MMHSKRYFYGAVLYVVGCFILTIGFIISDIMDDEKARQAKIQQEVIYSLQEKLVNSVENSLDRTNALAAMNFGKIRQLENHLGLREVEE